MEYYLMNQDEKLLLFRVTFDDFLKEYHVEEIERYVDDELFPPNFTRIATWLERRNYAKHKEHLKEWLKEWQLDNVSGFIEMTHALSLNDTLWVKRADSALMWESVSLYKNEFTDVVSKTAFEKGLHGLKLSTTSPEFTSEGSFEKCWIREGEDVFLYKKGSSGFANAGLESYSEYYATQYSAAICSSYVDYDLIKFKGSLVSRCKMFTSEAEGFVPIYKYMNQNDHYDFQDVLRFLGTYGFEEDFRNMIVLDSVILNPDRHFGNFGFIVDNKTFRILRFAPVFDHNMALLARLMKDDLFMDSPYLKELGHKLGPDFIPAGRAMLTESSREALLRLNEEPLRLHNTYNLPKERTDFLDMLIHHQIREILGKES